MGAPPQGTPIDATGNHYCMAVDDLEAAIAELEAKGISYERAVQGAGTVQIWISDPAGNTIELQQDAAAATQRALNLATDASLSPRRALALRRALHRVRRTLRALLVARR